MRRRLRFFIALCLLLPFHVAFLQDEAGISLDIIGIDSTELSEIAIHTSILDASGQLVSGLEVGNFSVGGDLANLATVTRVENITDDDLAFASVLVIDTSSSMADQPLSNALAAARDYLNALGPNDPVALITFNDQVRLVVNYTTDRALIFAQFENLAYGGQTALYDATLRAIEIANEAPLERKAVVILSDGGEYGNVSEHSRQDAIRAATIHGVPVYSIGLGWDIDRRFLEAISAESNGEFYEAPEPEELGEIYSNLAFLFRSQYIVTMSADVPADGTRYDFTLNVTTPDGQTSADAATLRAPIPVPLLFLPDDLFTEALTEDTQITVEIHADQEIESIEVELDGELVSTEETFTIEPVKEEPGEHQLDITVSDVEGDIGRLSTEFEIAALPPTVSDDFEPAPQADVAEAEVISVDAGGQTEITQVEFIVDGEVVHTDSEAPFEFDLDPFELSPTEHTLSIRATNAGGRTTTVDKAFEVETLPPRLEIEGLTPETVVSDVLTGSITVEGQSPIVSLSVDPDVGTLVASDRIDFTLEAADLPPGPNSFAVRAVDAAGAETVQTVEFEVAPLAPTVSISGVAVDALISEAQEVNVQAGGQTEITRVEVSYDGGPAEIVENEVFTIPAEELGDGEHEALVSVTNEGGQTSTISLPFNVQLPPTPTFTPLPTDTATTTSTATASSTAAPTATLTGTPVLTSTPSEEEVTATEEAIATLTATARPSATETDVATDTPIPPDTNTPLPTNTPIPPDTSTPLPTDTPIPPDTSTPLPTNTPIPPDTNTPLPTNTPIPPDTNTPLPTNTSVPTETNTPPPTDTSVPTETNTPPPTDTSVPTETNTPPPSDTSVPTETNTPPPTDTPVPTETNTPPPTDTPAPTETNTPPPTDTPVPTETNTPPPTDTPVPTETNTPPPTDTPVPTETNTPPPTDTPVPTETNTPPPTDTPVP
ncbi:MAG: VWA domain-containing protein, partial [Chloroflexi bacterium]|nr:VWA domain-containing protein [Chloroflexota bacterium]